MIKVSLEEMDGHLGDLCHALDRFIGTWSAEEEAEALKAAEVFEQVDDSFGQ